LPNRKLDLWGNFHCRYPVQKSRVDASAIDWIRPRMINVIFCWVGVFRSAAWRHGPGWAQFLCDLSRKLKWRRCPDVDCADRFPRRQSNLGSPSTKVRLGQFVRIPEWDALDAARVDWIEQGLTSHSTHFRSFRRRWDDYGISKD